MGLTSGERTSASQTQGMKLLGSVNAGKTMISKLKPTRTMLSVGNTAVNKTCCPSPHGDLQSSGERTLIKNSTNNCESSTGTDLPTTERVTVP